MEFLFSLHRGVLRTLIPYSDSYFQCRVTIIVVKVRAETDFLIVCTSARINPPIE